jgi:SAM-dependent methyltransferase
VAVFQYTRWTDRGTNMPTEARVGRIPTSGRSASQTAGDLPHNPTVGDAFGQLMIRCHEADAKPGAVVMVMERDDGLLTYGDAARYFQPLDDADSELDRQVLRRARGRVLDVGCGVGRHSLHLYQLGYDVRGLEVSPGAVAACLRRGLDVVNGSVFDPPPGLGLFSTFLLMGNNLGLLADPLQAAHLLESLARLASPNAIVLAEGIDPYCTDDPQHLLYHSYNRDLGRAPGQVRMRVWDGAVATEWFEWWQLSLDELKETLFGSGWTVQHVWRRPAGGGYLAELVQATSPPQGDVTS